ncbi:membrane-targeted effector domain-containing toxin [Pantoea cypripedii]|nr:membrane-targeted effector domain-containing toxin [Pantoea cypripedii]
MENNRIALSRSVTPATSPMIPAIQRPLSVIAPMRLNNVQLQPASFRTQPPSLRIDNPLISRASPAVPNMPTAPVPVDRIHLAHSSRSSPVGARQILPTHLMSSARSKNSQCIRPSARLTSLPPVIAQPSTSTAPPECHKFNQTDYEVPEKNRIIMGRLIHQKHRLSIEYSQTDYSEEQVKKGFFTLRDKLLKNATTHLPDLCLRKARPVMPDLAINDSPHTWIKKIYKKTDGMILGEFHGDFASKKFLIKNMSFLKRHGIKTLYMEHLLTDMHQNELDLYFSPKTKTIPSRLKHYLECLNEGFDIRSKYNFLKLIESAKEQGIRVQAIDAAASYYIDKVRAATNCRIRMMNYYAQGIINAHQEKEHGKWVALVGNQHANTFEMITGLAELTNGIGIRIKETEGKTAVIQPDKGEITLSSSSNIPAMEYNFIKSDFILTMPDKKRTRIGLSDNETERKLETGDFTIDTEKSMLKHRSRDGSIVNTPLSQDPDGSWFINKPDWKSINNTRYISVQDLVNDLKNTMRMNLVYSLK